MPPGTRILEKSCKGYRFLRDQEKLFPVVYLSCFPNFDFLRISWMTQWLNGSQSDFLYLLPVNSNYSLCPKYLSPRLLMIQISLNTESIRFATLQAIRMPTTYKCPDRIYRSGQIFVIQLSVRIADRNWTCTSLYQHFLISIDPRQKASLELTSHAHALRADTGRAPI